MRQAAQDLAATLPPLLVAAQRVAHTVVPGAHGRRRAGPGDDFWQFRPYQHFDSARLIDWRRSARGDTPFVREREIENAQTVYLWRDASPSMRWHSDRALPEKRERAALLTMALAVLLVEAGERVALLGEALRPRTGRSALEPMADLLTATADGAGSLPNHEPLPRHATAVIVGDLLDPLADIDGLVRHWAAEGVHGHLIQVTDPAEESFPYRGRVRFEGLEAEPETLLGRAEQVAEAYVDRLARHRDGLVTLARRAGWTFAHHVTDRPPETALLALYAAIGGRFE
ncbi:MAG: DUF58 domain-containing protein [Alphaproteobacteria bacterium]|nr:DUF58 domain-containing protein [Alphaproteobacteria bacterium]